MNRSTLISEMQKFQFGSRILCTDGQNGTLADVIFDPTTRELTSIGVKLGQLFGKTVHIPYDTVTGASSDAVTLRITRAEVGSASSAVSNGVRLDNRSVVERTGSPHKGTLMLVAVHPESGELAYIVVHNLRAGQDMLLREQYVTSLAADHITVSIPEADLDALPPYLPDSVLQREVERILFDLPFMHIDLKGITIRVLDSVLYLDGNISSKNRSDIAVDQALGVAGLMEVVNNLVSDDVLAADLARAMGENSITSDLPIGVYPRLGLVRLGGAVHTNQQRGAAGDIARNFPGVRGVINDLVVNPQAEELRVMSASEAGNAEDIVPGKWIRHTR